MQNKIDQVPEEFKQLADEFSKNGFITTTLDNLIKVMKSYSMNFIKPEVPLIIVKQLTQQFIEEARSEYDLNDSQLEQLMDKYVMTIVDSMSHEDFRQFVINTYYDDFSNYTLSQLLEEIKYTLDEEMLDEFITTIKRQSS